MERALFDSAPVTPLQLMDALKWRYATKIFDADRRVAEKDFVVLMEALRLSPSSIGLQPWKFLLIEDPALRRELRNISINQSQITDASHLLLLCSLEDMDVTYIDRMIEFEQRELGYEATMLEAFRPHAVAYIEAMPKERLREWMAEQVYIALGFLLSACAMLRIDACPIEAFDQEQANKLLGLDRYGVRARTLVAIGYASASDHHAMDKKVRFSSEDVFITI